jgi:hypothetical protein
MMSDIQRYVAIETDIASRAVVGDKEYAGCVDVVTYADHLAAVAAARAEERAELFTGDDVFRAAAKGITHGKRRGREQGQRDVLAKAIAAVEALGHGDPCVCEWCHNVTVVIAAIKGSDSDE